MRGGERIAYTVQEVANLAGITVKTLYHYQRLGLLLPASVGENGYRYYGEKELLRLQQILFYRELELPLKEIKTALEEERSRLKCLRHQQALLLDQKRRLEAVLNTLEESIVHTQDGTSMDHKQLFSGLNLEAWERSTKED